VSHHRACSLVAHRIARATIVVMARGIKYSYAGHSGYGFAALAYVRALHNAGIPVWWAPSSRPKVGTAHGAEDGLSASSMARHADAMPRRGTWPRCSKRLVSALTTP
jgi:hypothetical protein